MLFNIIAILGILFISMKFQIYFKIPLPLSVTLLGFLASLFFSNEFMGYINLESFSEGMLVFIVLLVLGDAFLIKLKDIKENWISIAFLAGFSVALSVLFGAFLSSTLFAEYGLSIGSLVALFAMCMATDPVAVVSTFNQYKLPHKLKFLAEGESLFNDAVALIMFGAFGLYMMKGGEITFGYVFSSTYQILIGSTIVGFVCGFIGTYFLKTTKTVNGELVLILLIAYISFYVAEHFPLSYGNHMSGLLSEIVAILTMTSIIDKSYLKEQKKLNNQKEILINESSNGKVRKKEVMKLIVDSMMTNITDVRRQEDIATFINVIALFVNAVLFVSLAKMINVNNLIHYWKEILGMFIVTTIIRAIMMGKFAIITNKMSKESSIDFSWWSVLLFAGIKGGLSIVMLYILKSSIPEFKHIVLFESIVIGVILLSMFIYVLGLLIVINKYSKKFEQELEEENLKGH